MDAPSENAEGAPDVAMKTIPFFYVRALLAQNPVAPILQGYSRGHNL